MYVPMPITDIALPLRHGMLYKNQSQVLQKCLTTTGIIKNTEVIKMQYDKTFKEEAVKLSDEIGLNAAANQLGIPYYTLSGWRNKRKKYQETAYVGSGNKRLSNDAKDQKICELEKEVLELQRSNDILKEALGFFAVSRKK